MTKYPLAYHFNECRIRRDVWYASNMRLVDTVFTTPLVGNENGEGFGAGVALSCGEEDGSANFINDWDDYSIHDLVYGVEADTQGGLQDEFFVPSNTTIF